MTAPMTPADSDLRDFTFMPLDVVRLRQSDLIAFENPEAIVAALLLWGAAWHSTPAGSLTDDDRALSQAAGYGRSVAGFLAIKQGALRGFTKCSDGRLYHPIVCEKANQAWQKKLQQRWRTECARIRKHNERNEEDKLPSPTFEQWNMSRVTETHVTRDATPLVVRDMASKGEGRDSKGRGKGEGDSNLFGAHGIPMPPDAEPKGSRKKIASQISDDFQPRPPTGETAKIIVTWSAEKMRREFEQFSSHHRSKESLFKDWDAAWRTWVLSSVKFQRGNGTSPAGHSGMPM